MSQQHAGQFLHGFQPLPAQLVDPFLQITQHGSFVAVIPQVREALLQQVGFENAPVQSKQSVQLTPLAAVQIEPTAQKQPALPSYQIPRGSSFAEELCPPAGMLQNVKLVVHNPARLVGRLGCRVKKPPAIQHDKERKSRENTCPARFFNSRGVPAPSSLRRIRLQLNAPTWTSCRFRMCSRPRRWQRRMPPVS